MLPESDEARLPPPTAPAPDADPLPEHTAYADTGCDVLDRVAYPSCLTCPLPACIHDVRPDRQTLDTRVTERRQLAGELARQGRTAGQIARALQTSRRTVQRDLRALEEAGRGGDATTE